MRLSRPASTRPAPASTARSQPSARRRCILSSQRTGAVTWRTSSSLTFSAARFTSAVTLAITSTSGARTVTSSRTRANPSAAGAISAQWNGALTANSTARLAPCSCASATARPTAPACPATTICPPPLRFAGDTTSPCPASVQTASTASGDRPNSAAIAPTPGGTAACISRPRSRTMRSASAKSSAPAATSAEYSPRLCPATHVGRRSLSCVNTRHAATLVARIAGWVLCVRVSSASGPEKQICDSPKPRAASASANVCAAAGNRSANARPIPTVCEP